MASELANNAIEQPVPVVSLATNYFNWSYDFLMAGTKLELVVENGLVSFLKHFMCSKFHSNLAISVFLKVFDRLMVGYKIIRLV